MNALRSAPGFTLVELLVVIVILLLLMGMGFLVSRDLLDRIKVQRTVYQVAQAFDDGRQAAASRSLVHSVFFNNVDPARTPVWVARSNRDGNGANDPDGQRTSAGDDRSEYASSRRGYAHSDPRQIHGVAQDPGATSTDWAGWRPTGSWTDEPRHQWMMVMGPWWDPIAGTWYQAKGGMPTHYDEPGRPAENQRYASVQVARMPDGRDRALPRGQHHPSWTGGIYGHPLTANGPGTPGWLPDAQRTLKYPYLDDPSLRPMWDPYGIALGGRRLFETGTRLMAPGDNPEWREAIRGNRDGLGIERSMVGYWLYAAPAILGGSDTQGQGGGGGVVGAVNNLNLYPSGRIGANHCNPNDTVPSAQAQGRPVAIIGIVGSRLKDARFANPRRSDGSADYDYARPAAQSFVVVWPTGEVRTGESPLLGF
ncbi:MAG: hypothetical protein RLZZ127_639 [Planctomycetota bacterium]|jgi:prepilin-type N-terminal cleavage/methylation domain-containing protein